MSGTAILLSTYNGERYLRDQIESILTQTSTDWRLYVRDDGSTDATRVMLTGLAMRDSRISLFFEANLGVAGSFFRLLRTAGEAASVYVFCDQDDIWHPEKLAVQAAALAGRSGSPALTYSALRLVDAAGAPLARQYSLPAAPEFPNILVQNRIAGCTMAINAAAASLVRENLPDPTNVVMHDWWILLVVSAFGTMLPTPDILVDYRQHGGNVIGIKNGLAGSVQRLRRVLAQRGRNRLMAQATAFLQLFGDELSPRQRNSVEHLLRTGRGPFRQRLYGVFDRSFQRTSRFDDLTLRLLAVVGHYRD